MVKSGATDVSADAFLRQIRDFKVIPESSLNKALTSAPPGASAKALATHLLHSGLLTRFQGARLLQGQGPSLRLGQYLLIEELGRGGMGRVFRAEHSAMGRIVALKILSADLVNSPRAKEFFLREVRAASRLHHPNIVTAFDANEVNGVHFLVMELVQGPNLEKLVRERGPLPAPVACEYIRQVAAGLEHAFEQGMVHRDIKPSNLLIKGEPEPSKPGLIKISDFGLARLAPIRAENAGSNHGTILVEENTIIGTPDYLAPEQAKSLHQADIRSDIYSLGCTLFFLLTGRVPYPGTKGLEKIIKHSTDPVPAPSTLVPGIPPEVDQLVVRMMAKDPADRPQTPREAAESITLAMGSGQAESVLIALATPIIESDPFSAFQQTLNDAVITPFHDKTPSKPPKAISQTREGNLSNTQAVFFAIVSVVLIAAIMVAALRFFIG